MSVSFHLHDPRWKSLLLKERAFFSRLAARALKEEKQKGIVSVVFTSDAEIKKLNRKFRKKNKPTNVLSFPLGEGGELGDVVLAYETIKKECTEQKKTFRAHVAHLLTHGTLHLLGHDHLNDKDAEKMESLEIKILKAFKIKNPY
jgi:probable rRNA maturation factor